jgi:medium-chain acyl-[acyl-carrier-protein] hydrolase
MCRVGRYEYKVQPMDIGFRETIRFAKLGGYLLDAAGEHAKDNGFGIDVLQQESLAWVLSRFAVEMYQYPSTEESFFVETWIEDFGRVFTTRNFKLTAANGATIGAGSSIWCMIDLALRKAVDLQSKQEYKDFATGTPPIIEKPRKVPGLSGEPVSRHRIKYSDIDFNHHTNSMKYIEWMIDLFPMEVYLHQQVKRVDINYVNEALFGDVVEICRDSPSLDVHAFDLRRGHDVVCKAQIVFENVR